MRGPPRNRTPYVVKTAGLQPAAPPWRVRPMCRARWHWLDDDASVVVNVQTAALEARRAEAGPEGVEPSARGFGIRSTTTGSSP